MDFTCPFCKGTGTDPYVEAIPAPTCPVCSGDETVTVRPDPEGRYLILGDDLVRYDTDLFKGERCTHGWTYVERDGQTWNVCLRCGRGELWAGGQLISSTDTAESAILDALLAERVSVIGAQL